MGEVVAAVTAPLERLQHIQPIADAIHHLTAAHNGKERVGGVGSGDTRGKLLDATVVVARVRDHGQREARDLKGEALHWLVCARQAGRTWRRYSIFPYAPGPSRHVRSRPRVYGSGRGRGTRSHRLRQARRSLRGMGACRGSLRIRRAPGDQAGRSRR
eukprot:scaffold181301_cov28-Tisochrysis_lutea.AAC.2